MTKKEKKTKNNKTDYSHKTIVITKNLKYRDLNLGSSKLIYVITFKFWGGSA